MKVCIGVLLRFSKVFKIGVQAGCLICTHVDSFREHDSIKHPLSSVTARLYSVPLQPRAIRAAAVEAHTPPPAVSATGPRSPYTLLKTSAPFWYTQAPRHSLGASLKTRLLNWYRVPGTHSRCTQAYGRFGTHARNTLLLTTYRSLFIPGGKYIWRQCHRRAWPVRPLSHCAILFLACPPLRRGVPTLSSTNRVDRVYRNSKQFCVCI